jgi:hypothetical protein
MRNGFTLTFMQCLPEKRAAGFSPATAFPWPRRKRFLHCSVKCLKPSESGNVAKGEAGSEEEE